MKNGKHETDFAVDGAWPGSACLCLLLLVAAAELSSLGAESGGLCSRASQGLPCIPAHVFGRTGLPEDQVTWRTPAESWGQVPPGSSEDAGLFLALSVPRSGWPIQLLIPVIDQKAFCLLRGLNITLTNKSLRTIKELGFPRDCYPFVWSLIIPLKKMPFKDSNNRNN